MITPDERGVTLARPGIWDDGPTSQIRGNTGGNIHPVQDVQTVQKTDQFGAIRRQKPYLRRVILVEGLPNGPVMPNRDARVAPVVREQPRAFLDAEHGSG
jgi:hypothetical protein